MGAAGPSRPAADGDDDGGHTGGAAEGAVQDGDGGHGAAG
ncbi:hypothetical protein Ae406Ps2_1130 [Pseudonocardia sp. Ae406_Ps2]|nr:hypothetical protein Ae406Ps2_1130 [Pseudonocardia sp. Ae406_Ps2]OLM07075.1 hypothetical protein Ae331Ps2_4785c [Pseudonocardia sp. Ae331_Ps2]OLM14270.1 hypothetical protein Ae505Ps2_4400c [Pseudonocardia sp. Ae505_Ps2]OLM22708.1 hypothetical protein Ae706Ps2_1140 [Pseudonocardia sp. Ae706_Ps2]